ncbi:LAMI_0C07382g1_1 [Lachancea mirantina]|uniref:LAMI_0C07382g1_1 n=1 Tax=Lachancea mirantina TaxID=1230905 RepID=A0A1G4J3V2_9SACH|nr:LAMI_0C07382g1_1 [Lachancea mirantina]
MLIYREASLKYVEPTRTRLIPRASSSSSDTDEPFCLGYDCSGSEWIWARWVLFVLFILAIAGLAFSAIRINSRRSRAGQRLIPGTAWFTPPSYRQSERQYNRGTRQEYVPPYSETANENDLGYYDNEGVFHVNSKAEMLPPPPLTTAVSDTSSGEVRQPQPAVVRDDASAGAESFNFTRDFRRYYDGFTATMPSPLFGRGHTHTEEERAAGEHTNAGDHDRATAPDPNDAHGSLRTESIELQGYPSFPQRSQRANHR